MILNVSGNDRTCTVLTAEILKGGIPDGWTVVTNCPGPCECDRICMVVSQNDSEIRSLNSELDCNCGRLAGIVIMGSNGSGLLRKTEMFCKTSGVRILAVIDDYSLAVEKVSAAIPAIIGPVPPVRSLSDTELSGILSSRDAYHHRPCKYRKPYSQRNSQCAMRGASVMLAEIRDLDIIVHGPRSCGYIVNLIRKNHRLFEMRNDPLMGTDTADNTSCTDMDTMCAVYGASERLKSRIEELIESGSRRIAVVTTCMAGLINEDAGAVIRGFDGCGIPITLIKTDGRMSGNRNSGFKRAIKFMASLTGTVDGGSPDDVNLVAGQFYYYNQNHTDEDARQLLSMFGLNIKRKLIEDLTLDEISHVGRNELNILVDMDSLTMLMAQGLEERGFVLYPGPLPYGYDETTSWMAGMAAYRGMEKEIAPVLEELEKENRRLTDAARCILSGKDILVLPSDQFGPEPVMNTISPLGAGNVYTASGSGTSYTFSKADDPGWSFGPCPIELFLRGHDVMFVIGELEEDSLGGVRVTRLDAHGCGFMMSFRLLKDMTDLSSTSDNGWRSRGVW